MHSERRQFERRAGPFEGSWTGPSGTVGCRISDLSPGGCFLDGENPGQPGSPITVTVTFRETRFSVPAEVTYLAEVRGFGVRFVSSDQQRALAYAMERQDD